MERVDNYIRGMLTGETIEEMALSSKHMRIVAGEISKIEDPDVRQQVTSHFSRIFSDANPRFDSDRFTAAAAGMPTTSGDRPRYRDSVSGGMTRKHFQQSADMLAGGSTDMGASDHIERIHGMMNPNFKPERFRSRAGMREGIEEGFTTCNLCGEWKDSNEVQPFADYKGVRKGDRPKVKMACDTCLDREQVKKSSGRMREGVDEAEIPMNYSFKRKERGPGMVATSSRVELNAKGARQNVTRSEIIKPAESPTGKSYGLYKSQPVGVPERPAGVRPVQPTQRLTPPGGPNAQTNAPKRPSTPSWHSEAPKPYRPTESLADKARRVVDEYIEDVRAEVREALSMPSSGTTSTSTGSTTKSSSSPGKVSTTVPAASAVSTGSTKTKSI